MKPSDPHHIYYISEDELAADIKIAFVSILAVLITVVDTVEFPTNDDGLI